MRIQTNYVGSNVQLSANGTTRVYSAANAHPLFDQSSVFAMSSPYGSRSTSLTWTSTCSSSRASINSSLMPSLFRSSFRIRSHCRIQSVPYIKSHSLEYCTYLFLDSHLQLTLEHAMQEPTLRVTVKQTNDAFALLNRRERLMMR